MKQYQDTGNGRFQIGPLNFPDDMENADRRKMQRELDAVDESGNPAPLAEILPPIPVVLPDVDDIFLGDVHKLEMLLEKFPPTPADKRAQRERMRERGEA